MRPLRMMVILAIVFSATLSLAQTPPPPPPDMVATLSALVERAEDAAAVANKSSEEATTRVDNAFSLLNLFESIGLIVAVFAVAAPAIGGFYTVNVRRANRRVQGARRELEQTRRNIEKQLDATRNLQATSAELEKRLNSASEDFKRASEELDTRVRDALRELEEQMIQNRTQLLELRAALKDSVLDQQARTTKALQGQSLQVLGERQYRERNLEGAIETLNRAIELDDRNPITHYQIGYVYVQHGVLDEAEFHLKKALEIDPKLGQAMATLGYVYRRMAEKLDMSKERIDQFNQAERLLLDALDISDRLIDSDGESWWGSLGGLYRRQGQIDQAIHAYERAAKVTPRSSYPFSNLAMLYLEKGNLDAMRENFARVEQLASAETQADSNNYWAFADLVTSRLAQNKTKETDAAIASLLYTVPSGSSYVLESLLDTLERLLKGLGGPDAAPQIPPYIQGIHDHIEKFNIEVGTQNEES
ncbi:MAG: tetratricopeptide repeat protein [Anaerolineae bacterium]|nr:tetratricopeptide repeat protein [Anaerolineae bacterium]